MQQLSPALTLLPKQARMINASEGIRLEGWTKAPGRGVQPVPDPTAAIR